MSLAQPFTHSPTLTIMPPPPPLPNSNVTVSGTVLLADLAGVVADLYPNSSFKRPLFLAPKWLVWLVGPLAGMPRDAVTHTLGYVPRFDSSKIQTELGLKFLDIKVRAWIWGKGGCASPSAWKPWT